MNKHLVETFRNKSMMLVPENINTYRGIIIDDYYYDFKSNLKLKLKYYVKEIDGACISYMEQEDSTTQLYLSIKIGKEFEHYQLY